VRVRSCQEIGLALRLTKSLGLCPGRFEIRKDGAIVGWRWSIGGAEQRVGNLARAPWPVDEVLAQFWVGCGEARRNVATCPIRSFSCPISGDLLVAAELWICDPLRCIKLPGSMRTAEAQFQLCQVLEFPLLSGTSMYHDFSPLYPRIPLTSVLYNHVLRTGKSHGRAHQLGRMKHGHLVDSIRSFLTIRAYISIATAAPPRTDNAQ
jgi:hypothetical protein